MIHLNIRGDRVTLSAPWSPSLVADCKSISGWSFTKTKIWTYPLSMNTLRRLREVFGEQLSSSPELLAWAKEQRSRERTLKRLSRRDDARLRIVPEEAPTLAQAMAERTYQRSGAAFGARAGSFLLADEPGLGKTATSLAAIIEGGNWMGDHLVICPKASIESVWGRQIRMWTDGDAIGMPDGAAKRRAAWEEFQEIWGPKFLIVNLAMIRRQYGHYCKKCDIWEEDVKSKKTSAPKQHYLQDHRYARKIKSEDWPDILNHDWKTVILDEAHEALAAYTPANVSQQTQGLLDLKAENRIALTGTPLRGSETRLWGISSWLGLKTGGYWGWVKEYFELSDGFFGGKMIHGLDPAREKAFYAWVDGFVLRRTRREVRPDLPMGQRMDVLVEMSKKHREQYERFKIMGETELENGVVSGQGVLSELTRLKQLAYGTWNDPGGRGKLVPSGDSPKIEFILQFLKERGITGKKTQDWFPENGSGYKYVISSMMTEIVDDVERQLNDKGIKTLKITGGVSGSKRTDAIAKFQSDDKEFRVMLISTTAGGASIELDAWCDEMIILDESYVADDQVQLEGRINNRSGRVAPRQWWYVRTADTVEQTIAEGNYMQHDLQHKLLDGRRGVDVALHLIRGGR